MKAKTMTAIAGILFSSQLIAAPVNINNASAKEIATALNGIGERKAAAVVAYRELHGPFQAAGDITLVKGIGDSIYQMNKTDIQVK